MQVYEVQSVASPKQHGRLLYRLPDSPEQRDHDGQPRQNDQRPAAGGRFHSFVMGHGSPPEGALEGRTGVATIFGASRVYAIGSGSLAQRTLRRRKEPRNTKKSVYIQPSVLIFQSPATGSVIPMARLSGNHNTLKPMPIERWMVAGASEIFEGLRKGQTTLVTDQSSR
jgi:hypothetical protein